MEATIAAQRHAQLRERATSYRARPVEVPSEPGCAGDCTIPVPEPPVRRREGFAAVGSPESTRVYGLLLATAAIGYVVLTMTVRARG